MQLNEKLKSIYPNLTKTEKKIADYFMEPGPDTLSDFTLEQLSDTLHVGQSTIMRFVHKCGYSSLRTFIIDSTASKYISSIDVRSGFQNDIGVFYQNLTDQILSFSLNLDQKTIRQIADKIVSADVVICIGEGYSEYMAELCAYRFVRSSIFAVTHPSHLKVWDVHTILKYHKNAVVLVFSISGETAAVADTVRHYQLTDSTYIVALTSYIHSSIAKLSNAHIYIPSAPIFPSREAGIDGIVNMMLAIENIIIECFKIKEAQEDHPC